MDTSLSSSSSGVPLTAHTQQQQQQQRPQNALLRSVECHVRLLQSPENVIITRDKSQPFTQFEFTRSGAHAAVPPPTAVAAAPGGVPMPQTMAAGSSSSGGAAGGSSKFQCTSLHVMTSNKEFFEAVVRPCVSNAAGGQSYTFLVCGPPSSGRSQTLYGNGGGRDPGILELTARELLALGGGAAASSTMAASLTSTVASFVCMGPSVVDCTTQADAAIREFPPPLGTLALPTMALLTDPAVVAQQPKLKISYTHSSSFTQFHVYRALNPNAAAAAATTASSGASAAAASGGNVTAKYAMAAITFIDVAAFTAPTLPPDLQHLVALVAGLVSGGSDINFRHCRLTELLEQSLVGPTTLVAIGNISAKPDLQEPAGVMLRLLMKLSQMHQILMLLQLQVPKWIAETGPSLHALAKSRDAVTQRAYERGVSDYFTVAAGIAQRMSNIEGAFGDVVDEAEDVRSDIRQQVAQQLATLQRAVDAGTKDSTDIALAAKSGNDVNARQMEDLEALGVHVASLEKDIAVSDVKTDHRLEELRMQVSSLANDTTSRRREREAYGQETSDHRTCVAEFDLSAVKYLDDLKFLQRHFALDAENDALSFKKQRLEADLELASRSAHQSNHSHRLERERRSKVARVTLLEAKVSNIMEMGSKQSSMAKLLPPPAPPLLPPPAPAADGALDLDGPPVVLGRSSPHHPTRSLSNVAAAGRSRNNSASVSGMGGGKAMPGVDSPLPRLGGTVETTLF